MSDANRPIVPRFQRGNDVEKRGSENPRGCRPPMVKVDGGTLSNAFL